MSKWSGKILEKNSSQNFLSMYDPLGVQVNNFVTHFRKSSKRFVIEIFTKNLALNLSGALFFMGLGCSLKWWYKDQLFIVLLKQNLPALSEPQQQLSWETGEYVLKEQNLALAKQPFGIPKLALLNEQVPLSLVTSTYAYPFTYGSEGIASTSGLLPLDPKVCNPSDPLGSIVSQTNGNQPAQTIQRTYYPEGFLLCDTPKGWPSSYFQGGSRCQPQGPARSDFGSENIPYGGNTFHQLLERLDLYMNYIVVKFKPPWQKHAYQRFVGVFSEPTPAKSIPSIPYVVRSAMVRSNPFAYLSFASHSEGKYWACEAGAINPQHIKGIDTDLENKTTSEVWDTVTTSAELAKKKGHFFQKKYTTWKPLFPETWFKLSARNLCLLKDELPCNVLQPAARTLGENWNFFTCLRKPIVCSLINDRATVQSSYTSLGASPDTLSNPLTSFQRIGDTCYLVSQSGLLRSIGSDDKKQRGLATSFTKRMASNSNLTDFYSVILGAKLIRLRATLGKSNFSPLNNGSFNFDEKSPHPNFVSPSGMEAALPSSMLGSKQQAPKDWSANQGYVKHAKQQLTKNLVDNVLPSSTDPSLVLFPYPTLRIPKEAKQTQVSKDAQSKQGGKGQKTKAILQGKVSFPLELTTAMAGWQPPNNALIFNSYLDEIPYKLESALLTFGSQRETTPFSSTIDNQVINHVDTMNSQRGIQQTILAKFFASHQEANQHDFKGKLEGVCNPLSPSTFGCIPNLQIPKEAKQTKEVASSTNVEEKECKGKEQSETFMKKAQLLEIKQLLKKELQFLINTLPLVVVDPSLTNEHSHNYLKNNENRKLRDWDTKWSNLRLAKNSIRVIPNELEFGTNSLTPPSSAFSKLQIAPAFQVRNKEVHFSGEHLYSRSFNFTPPVRGVALFAYPSVASQTKNKHSEPQTIANDVYPSSIPSDPKVTSPESDIAYPSTSGNALLPNPKGKEWEAVPEIEDKQKQPERVALFEQLAIPPSSVPPKAILEVQDASQAMQKVNIPKGRLAEIAQSPTDADNTDKGEQKQTDPNLRIPKEAKQTQVGMPVSKQQTLDNVRVAKKNSGQTTKDSMVKRNGDILGSNRLSTMTSIPFGSASSGFKGNRWSLPSEGMGSVEKESSNPLFLLNNLGFTFNNLSSLNSPPNLLPINRDASFWMWNFSSFTKSKHLMFRQKNERLPSPQNATTSNTILQLHPKSLTWEIFQQPDYEQPNYTHLRQLVDAQNYKKKLKKKINCSWINHTPKIFLQQKRTTIANTDSINRVDKGVNFVNKRSRLMSGYVYPDLQSQLLRKNIYQWLTTNRIEFSKKRAYLEVYTSLPCLASNTRTYAYPSSIPKVASPRGGLLLAYPSFASHSEGKDAIGSKKSTDSLTEKSLMIPFSGGPELHQQNEMYWFFYPESFRGVNRLIDNACLSNIEVPITPTTFLLRFFPTCPSSIPNLQIADPNLLLASLPSESEGKVLLRFLRNPKVRYANEGNKKSRETATLEKPKVRSKCRTNKIVLPYEKFNHHLAFFPGFLKPSQFFVTLPQISQGDYVTMNAKESALGGNKPPVPKATMTTLGGTVTSGMGGSASRISGIDKFLTDCNARGTAYRGIVIQRNKLTKDLQPFKKTLGQSSIWGLLLLGPENPLTDRQCHFFGQKQLSTLDVNNFQRDYLRQLGKEIVAQSNRKGFAEKLPSIERAKILSFSKTVNSFFFKKRKYAYLLEKTDQWYLLFQEQLRTAMEDTRKYPPLTPEETKNNSIPKGRSSGRIKVSAPLIMTRFPKEIAKTQGYSASSSTYGTASISGSIPSDSGGSAAKKVASPRDANGQQEQVPKEIQKAQSKQEIPELQRGLFWRPFCYVDSSDLLTPRVISRSIHFKGHLYSSSFSFANSYTPIQNKDFSTSGLRSNPSEQAGGRAFKEKQTVPSLILETNANIPYSVRSAIPSASEGSEAIPSDPEVDGVCGKITTYPSGQSIKKTTYHYPLLTERQSLELTKILQSNHYKKDSFSIFNVSRSVANNLRWLIQEPLTANSWAVISQWFFLVALLFWIEQMLLGNVFPALFALEQLLVGTTGIKTSDRTHIIRVSKPSASNTPKFQDLAGIDGLLGELSELVLFLRGHKERLWNKKSSYGVLLTGPPGTGKTFLVRALANEARVPVLILSAGTLIANKLNTTKPSWSIRHAFRRAKQLAPCVLFIDEIDALGKSRGKIVTDSNEITASAFSTSVNFSGVSEFSVNKAPFGIHGLTHFEELAKQTNLAASTSGLLHTDFSGVFSYQQSWPSVSDLLLNEWEHPLKSIILQESNEINRCSICEEKLFDLVKARGYGRILANQATTVSNRKSEGREASRTPSPLGATDSTTFFTSHDQRGAPKNAADVTHNFVGNGGDSKRKFGPLTQLLVSMDGVSSLSGVLIMGATNRPELLDSALTRPGRFERIIRIEKPSEQKRIEILQLYSHNLGVQHQIPWHYLANRTRGLTAADLAVAMNYSSLKAIIQGSTHTIETIEYGLNSITRFFNKPFGYSSSLHC